MESSNITNTSLLQMKNLDSSCETQHDCSSSTGLKPVSKSSRFSEGVIRVLFEVGQDPKLDGIRAVIDSIPSKSAIVGPTCTIQRFSALIRKKMKERIDKIIKAEEESETSEKSFWKSSKISKKSKTLDIDKCDALFIKFDGQICTPNSFVSSLARRKGADGIPEITVSFQVESVYG